MHAQTHRHTHNAPISGTLLLGTLPLPPAVHPSSEICLAVALAIMLVNAARPCDPILFICVCVCVFVCACARVSVQMDTGCGVRGLNNQLLKCKCPQTQGQL